MHLSLSSDSALAIKEAEVDNDVAYYTIYYKADSKSSFQQAARARYSQFEALHKKLTETIDSGKFTAVLPPKHSWILTSHSDPGFVEQRREKLEIYLRQVLAIEEARVHPAFRDFLTGRKGSSDLPKKQASSSNLQWAWSLIMPTQESEKGGKSKGPQELSSVLIKEVSHPDDTEAEAGSTITKTWLIKNDGTATWPEGTSLVEDKETPGTLKFSAEHPPRAAPGDTVEVRMKIQVPSIPGKYRTGSLTLAYEGGSFGAVYSAQIVVRARTDDPLKMYDKGRLRSMMKEFLRDDQVVKTLQAELPFILGAIANGSSIKSIVETVTSRRHTLKSHPFVEYFLPRLSTIDRFISREMAAFVAVYTTCMEIKNAADSKATNVGGGKDEKLKEQEKKPCEAAVSPPPQEQTAMEASLPLEDTKHGPSSPGPSCSGEERKKYDGAALQYGEQLNKLLGMGFDETKSRRLLERYEGDVTKALNVLIHEES
mmetsp:Transcript_2769/g.5500  ORF Transcript_2769/g.5500 Transcript_2769/m.5500 type:complete len:484 (+) Transcript_2769:42-1493(+)|eukprot:CAMPEP_0167790964 /NCGR_PEP_ID=MMETSP0111_2-20121227/11634_1 /TAXON_ID=91324 /ORGANISM="Lotharella globosa, Strain CCCM811" /LENGTH=483 /DNA_ID=CAMNT_0007683503 /DNA_START=35 /DNA_END=1486 /DNA_ORIENTATION=-